MKRLLIAEDEDGIRRMIRSILERRGFHITEARNGKEAINFLSSETFDLLLVDLMMPMVSGYRVIEELRARQPNVPAIVITAAGEIGRGLLPDGVQVIRKPFDPQALAEAVIALIGVESEKV